MLVFWEILCSYKMNDILQKINSSRLKKIVQSLYNQEHHKIPQQVKIGVIF